MQAYKFNIKVSENGIISLPQARLDLYGKEVELLILVPKDDMLKKTKKVSTKPFIARWAGCLKDADFDPDNAKYEYLSEKHQ